MLDLVHVVKDFQDLQDLFLTTTPSAADFRPPRLILTAFWPSDFVFVHRFFDLIFEVVLVSCWGPFWNPKSFKMPPKL